MSITVSSALNLVLDGIDQQVDVRVTLSLAVGPYNDFSRALASLSLSAQNGTDLPAGVRDIAGFTATSGDIVLSGSVDPGGDESKTVAWLLNPDSSTSPLYRTSIKRTPVTIDLGYVIAGGDGIEWVRKFTGSVASYTLDHAAGTATLLIVDRSVDYDALPLVPGAVTAAPYNAGLTSAFAMDAVIRTNRCPSTWPATRPRAVLAVGLVSSLWPEFGSLYTAASQPIPAFAPGAYAPGLSGYDPIAANTVLNQNVWNVTGLTNDVYFEFLAVGVDVGGVQAILGGLSGSAGLGTSVPQGVTLISDAASTRLYLRGNLVLTRAAAGPGVHYLAAHVAYSGTSASGTFTGTMWVDGAAQGFTFTTSDTLLIALCAPGNIQVAAVAPLGAGAVVNGLQVDPDPFATPTLPFTPAAILDISLNPLTVVPEIPAGSKGSDELQTMAGAELGFARFDEWGVFRFTNRNTIAQAAIARTVTADTGLKPGLSTDIGADTEYDHIQVPFTVWTQGTPTALFILAEVKKIPPRQTVSWTQPLGVLAVGIATTATLLPDGHNPADGGSYYRASQDVYGNAKHPGVTVTITQVSAATVVISITNPTGLTAWLTTPASNTDLTAGSASSGLWIGGTPVNPSAEALTDSIYGPGTKPVLSVASNPYLQNQAAAQALGDYLLPQLIAAVRDFTGVDVIPDPRLQLPDKVHLTEPYRALIDEYAQVWGWSFTANFPPPGQSGGTWDMTLDLRAFGPPGAWLLGIPGRSELGDGASTPGTAYLYD